MGKRNRVQKATVPVRDVDIVIPIHNQFDYLQRCLDCLPAACEGITYHAYLVDNASMDVKKDTFYKALDFRHNTAFGLSENVGFPMACNVGARAGKSKYILFLNSDCFMKPGSIAHMLSVFKTKPEVGIVGAKLVFPKLDTYDPQRPVGKIQHAGLSFTIGGRVEHIFIAWSPDHPKVNVSMSVPAVTGACLMIERQLFQKVGMFYEGYGMGTFEDVDLCTAVRAENRVVWYDAQAEGEHVAGGTAKTAGIKFPLERNRYIFIGRWGHMVYWSDFERY